MAVRPSNPRDEQDSESSAESPEQQLHNAVNRRHWISLGILIINIVVLIGLVVGLYKVITSMKPMEQNAPTAPIAEWREKLDGLRAERDQSMQSLQDQQQLVDKLWTLREQNSNADQDLSRFISQSSETVGTISERIGRSDEWLKYHQLELNELNQRVVERQQMQQQEIASERRLTQPVATTDESATPSTSSESSAPTLDLPSPAKAVSDERLNNWPGAHHKQQ